MSVLWKLSFHWGSNITEGLSGTKGRFISGKESVQITTVYKIEH